MESMEPSLFHTNARYVFRTCMINRVVNSCYIRPVRSLELNNVVLV